MKYIIVDLDDTLLTSKKQITDYTYESLKRFQKNGYKIVFNTARSFKSAYKYIEMVQPDYSIINGGVQIYDKNKTLIYAKTVSKDITNKIIDKILHDDQVDNFSIQGENELYSRDESYIKRIPIANYFDFKTPFFEKSAKILISARNIDKWKKVAKQYNLEFESYFDGKWIRICPSNKYRGNQALFDLLNDKDPKDYVFGDDNGDVEMIEKAYHGVYLSNTNPKLLKNAKHITMFDNNNDGVVRYLEKILEV